MPSACRFASLLSLSDIVSYVHLRSAPPGLLLTAVINNLELIWPYKSVDDETLDLVLLERRLDVMKSLLAQLTQRSSVEKHVGKEGTVDAHLAASVSAAHLPFSETEQSLIVFARWLRISAVPSITSLLTQLTGHEGCAYSTCFSGCFQLLKGILKDLSKNPVYCSTTCPESQYCVQLCGVINAIMKYAAWCLTPAMAASIERCTFISVNKPADQRTAICILLTCLKQLVETGGFHLVVL